MRDEVHVRTTISGRISANQLTGTLVSEENVLVSSTVVSLGPLIEEFSLSASR